MRSSTETGFIKAAQAVDTQLWQLLGQPSMSNEFQIRTGSPIVGIFGDMTTAEGCSPPVLSSVDALCQRLNWQSVYDPALDQLQLVFECPKPVDLDCCFETLVDWFSEVFGVRSVNLVFTAPCERSEVSPLVRKAPTVANL